MRNDAPEDDGQPLEQVVVACLRGPERGVHVCMAVGLGAYLAWVYVMCFSTLAYPPDAASRGIVPWCGIASYTSYVAMLAVCMGAWKRAMRVPRVYVLLFGATCGIGTALVSLFSAVGGWQGFAVSFAASVATGLGSGYVLVCWARLFASDRACATFHLAGGLIVSFAATLLMLVLPSFAALFICSLLPLASALAIAHVYRCKLDGVSLAKGAKAPVSGIAADAADESRETLFVEQKERSLFHLPWRFALGLVSMGFSFGMAHGFAFEYAECGFECSVGCLVINGVLGAFLLAYAVKTRKNFGYSAANMAILPLAGFAQCMLAVFRVDLVIVSFFIMRLAYMLFDVLLWLQLPEVFHRHGTIRSFLVARILFEGSSAVGIAVRALLAFTGFAYFDAVALAIFAFLLVALTLAFQGGSVGTVWNLMPAPSRGGLFRKACGIMTERFGLTPREREIMELVLRARSGTFIQEKLVISKSTFQTHMRNMYHKLDVHSNQELLDVLEATIVELRDDRN